MQTDIHQNREQLYALLYITNLDYIF